MPHSIWAISWENSELRECLTYSPFEETLTSVNPPDFVDKDPYLQNVSWENLSNPGGYDLNIRPPKKIQSYPLQWIPISSKEVEFVWSLDNKKIVSKHNGVINKIHDTNKGLVYFPIHPFLKENITLEGTDRNNNKFLYMDHYSSSPDEMFFIGSLPFQFENWYFNKVSSVIPWFALKEGSLQTPFFNEVFPSASRTLYSKIKDSASPYGIKTPTNKVQAGPKEVMNSHPKVYMGRETIIARMMNEYLNSIDNLIGDDPELHLMKGFLFVKMKDKKDHYLDFHKDFLDKYSREELVKAGFLNIRGSLIRSSNKTDKIQELLGVNKDDLFRMSENLDDKSLIGNGYYLRDLSILDSQYYYFPAFSIFSSAGNKIAKLNKKSWENFWKQHHAYEFGRAKAKVLLRYGLQLKTPHGQSILYQLSPNNLRPTGKFLLRDFPDMQFVKGFFEEDYADLISDKKLLEHHVVQEININWFNTSAFFPSYILSKYEIIYLKSWAIPHWEGFFDEVGQSLGVPIENPFKSVEDIEKLTIKSPSNAGLSYVKKQIVKAEQIIGDQLTSILANPKMKQRLKKYRKNLRFQHSKGCL